MRTPAPANVVLVLLLMATAVHGAVPDCYEARTYTQAGLGSMAYRLAQPAGGVQPGVTYPLVVVLHGNGGQGSDNLIQIGGEALFFADDARRAAYPAFVLAPQCLANDKWADVDFFAGTQAQKPATVSQRLLIGIIDDLIALFPVAANRVKLLGFSMGGYGTWDLITRYPGRFEAAVPISGGGDPTKATFISRTRIWAHHCPSDPIVPYRGSTDMMAALTTALYPIALLPNGGGHDSGVPLATPGLLDWLMEDRLSVRLVPASTQDVEIQRIDADPNTVPGDGNGTVLGEVSSATIEIGSTNGGSRGTCGVFPFAIPAIAPASLHTADLAFSTNPQFLGGFKLPLDIYALDDRAAASATLGDYFLGVHDSTGAALLESLANWTSPALVATSGVGRVALTQRLTSAIQAGHAGQFLTIRVNPLSVRIGGMNGSFAAGSTVFSGDSSTPPVLILLLTSGAPKPGDLTGDGVVDQADITVLKALFGRRSGDAGWNPTADTDGNLRIDAADLGLVLRQQGR
jgi:dienelactone hydrolase